MPKAILLLCCFFVGHLIWGQDSLPVIKATSTNVDIRVGDKYFAKNAWNLAPEMKPDVFSIGSK